MPLSTASADQLQVLFDAALDAVIGIDSAGQVISWNRQATTIFGWEAAEVLGQLLSALIIPERYRRSHEEGLQHYLATGEGPVLNTRIEITAADRHDREFPVELAIIPLDLPEGVAFYAFLRDISQRKALQADLERRATEARILFDASMLVAQGGTFEDLVRSCLGSICAATRWPLGHAYIVDEDAGLVVPTGLWHPREHPFAQRLSEFRFEKGRGMPGRIWQSGEPEHITNISQVSDFPRRDVMAGFGIRSAFGFPVHIDGKVSAILEFFSTEELSPDPEQAILVRTLGTQLGRVVERHFAVEEQRLLQRELAHRAGNLMAITAAVFRRSAQQAETVDELSRGFEARLQALTRATALLSQGGWRAAPLSRVLDDSLEPFGRRNQTLVDGPDVQLDSSNVTTMSLIFNELATNALKHGAYQTPNGAVSVTWDVVEVSRGQRALDLRWTESGGPAVEPPERKGFGSALFESLIGRKPGGEVETEFRPHGLRIRFRIPLGA